MLPQYPHSHFSFITEPPYYMAKCPVNRLHFLHAAVWPCEDVLPPVSWKSTSTYRWASYRILTQLGVYFVVSLPPSCCPECSCRVHSTSSRLGWYRWYNECENCQALEHALVRHECFVASCKNRLPREVCHESHMVLCSAREKPCCIK